MSEHICQHCGNVEENTEVETEQTIWVIIYHAKWRGCSSIGGVYTTKDGALEAAKNDRHRGNKTGAFDVVERTVRINKQIDEMKLAEIGAVLEGVENP